MKIKQGEDMKIKVGIFWVIKGKVYSKIQEKEIENERKKNMVKIFLFVRNLFIIIFTEKCLKLKKEK